MAEYIDKKKAINKFIEGDGDDEFTEGYNFAVNEYREKIKAIATADVQFIKQWISVNDRLPEPDTMVIVACYGSDIVIPDYEHGETVCECVKRLEKECVRVTLGFIGSDGWYDSDYSPMIISPSYWQPLPEPPVND